MFTQKHIISFWPIQVSKYLQSVSLLCVHSSFWSYPPLLAHRFLMCLLCAIGQLFSSCVSPLYRLEYCGLTSLSCEDLSSSLLSNQRLIKMNLTQNNMGSKGIRRLCEVLRSPECKLQVLGLHKESFDKEAQKLLEAVEVSNPHLVIKPFNSDHNNEDASWWRYF